MQNLVHRILALLTNIDIDIDKDNLDNINIDKAILENIDSDKENLEDIDIDTKMKYF